jgi:SMC proteins Flexible Hinge Domain
MTLPFPLPVPVSTILLSKPRPEPTSVWIFLRKYNLGRASFICLDKLAKGAHDRTVETPEGAPRLFDLIRPVKANLAPAFFLAVGNTLVADDLDTASRWCYDFGGKRWRVVTKDGKLLETSGTQSGGGNIQRKGGMRLEVCLWVKVDGCFAIFCFGFADALWTCRGIVSSVGLTDIHCSLFIYIEWCDSNGC